MQQIGAMSILEQIIYQIWGKSLKSIRRISWVLFISSIPPKIFALKYSAFSVNWCKYPILVG